MSRFASLIITLPVIVLPALLTTVVPVRAEITAAEQAVQILARARAADAKCNILSSGERQELGRYVARAEVAAVSQVSASVARSAAATGSAQGQGAVCSAAAKADVKETLVAARTAIAVSDRQSRSRVEAEPEDTPEQAPKKRKKVAQAEAEDTPDAVVSTGTLERYSRAVRAYYVERRCRHLSKGQAGRYWQAIVRMHKGVVAKYGAGRVKPVMRRAEQQAANGRCGGSTAAMVNSGLALSQAR